MFYSPSNVLRLFLCGCNAQAVINEELLWSVGVLEYWKDFQNPKEFYLRSSITPLLQCSITPMLSKFLLYRDLAQREYKYIWSVGV
jgi:hypothetical protein